uniref:Uncharacterized protein n=1 Tax=Stegastes partitus TaxID=144197 RepID=A0A3B4ZJK8_9TELE
MAHSLTNWNTGLFGCCKDTSSCCYGFWCCPCLACTVAGKFDENRCLPLCDICSPAVLSALGIPLAVPPAVLALRVGVRHQYGIKVQHTEDPFYLIAVLYCGLCYIDVQMIGSHCRW